MLYASANQINAVVPYAVRAPIAKMTVQGTAGTDGPRAIPVADGSLTSVSLPLDQQLKPKLPVSVQIRGQNAPVQYAGAAK